MIMGEAGPTTLVLDNSMTLLFLGCGVSLLLRQQRPVVQSLVSANCWLRGIKTYRFPWYLTLVSASYALSNPGQE